MASMSSKQRANDHALREAAKCKQQANERALREAAKLNDLNTIRILLSLKTSPNSQDEVKFFLSFCMKLSVCNNQDKIYMILILKI